jgi:hypothetical protein
MAGNRSRTAWSISDSGSALIIRGNRVGFSGSEITHRIRAEKPIQG